MLKAGQLGSTETVNMDHQNSCLMSRVVEVLTHFPRRLGYDRLVRLFPTACTFATNIRDELPAFSTTSGAGSNNQCSDTRRDSPSNSTTPSSKKWLCCIIQLASYPLGSIRARLYRHQHLSPVSSALQKASSAVPCAKNLHRLRNGTNLCI